MSLLRRRSRHTALGATFVVVVALLAASPATADDSPTGYSSWVAHEEAQAPGPGSTYSWVGADAEPTPWVDDDPAPRGLQLAGRDHEVHVRGVDADGTDIRATFQAPLSHGFTSGETYDVTGMEGSRTESTGSAVVLRGGTMCGKDESQLFEGFEPANPVTGRLHVIELEADGGGNVTRFAATYELNCQAVSGQPGLQGSIAVNASQPAAAVPEPPATPGPVTGLNVTNVGDVSNTTSRTTLRWTNPAGTGDVDVTYVQLWNPVMPVMVGVPWIGQNVGAASSFVDPQVDFMDTRTYRVVARGPTGRVGQPRQVTVRGTRLDLPVRTETLTIGEATRFDGRLSAAIHASGQNAMKGPGIVGRTLVVCRHQRESSAPCDQVGTVRTGTDGRFAVTVVPTANSWFDVRLPATPGMLANSSAIFTTLVAPATDLASRRRSVSRHRSVRFTTSGSRTGSRGVVWLQRYDGRRWRTVATRHLTRHPAGRVSRVAITFRDRTPGRHRYRAVKPGDKYHVTGYSRVVRVRVR